MLLSQTAEYAFRAMSCLASFHSRGAVRSQELSQRANIPVSYLAKVMRRLVLAGLVDSQRGRGGGFQLARPPGKIRFIDILRAVDHDAEVGRCAFGIGDCNPQKPCPLHPAWSALQDTFLRWAHDNTLAELANKDFCMPAQDNLA